MKTYIIAVTIMFAISALAKLVALRGRKFVRTTPDTLVFDIIALVCFILWGVLAITVISGGN